MPASSSARSPLGRGTGLTENQLRAILQRYAERRAGAVFDLAAGTWRRGEIFDSARALTSALETAASMAAMLLTASIVLMSAREQGDMR